jgi:hypothetical protein
MTRDRYGNLVFVDCEAAGTSPVSGVLTEFGAVHYATRETFHGRLWVAHPDPVTPAIPVPVEKIVTEDEVAGDFIAWLIRLKLAGRPVLVSDNPAYDFMWIAGLFDTAGMPNPFGHSGRRISDFWAGIRGSWGDTQSWKRFRKTPHDHNPVNDAMGNCEAFERILQEMKGVNFRLGGMVRLEGET